MGETRTVLQPWIEGETPDYDYDNRMRMVLQFDNNQTENNARLQEMRFFDQVVANADRFDNRNGVRNPGNFMVESRSGLVYGIDHALAFPPVNESIPESRVTGLPDFTLIGSPSVSEVASMRDNLAALEPAFARYARGDSHAEMMSRFDAGAEAYLNPAVA
jgi:hypothetical protein